LPGGTSPCQPLHATVKPCRIRKAVAGMLRVPAVRRPVEPLHNRLVAAIGHVVYQAPVAAIEIERLQDPEVADNRHCPEPPRQMRLNNTLGTARQPNDPARSLAVFF
jgi:hypothetical protein